MLSPPYSNSRPSRMGWAYFGSIVKTMEENDITLAVPKKAILATNSRMKKRRGKRREFEDVEEKQSKYCGPEQPRIQTDVLGHSLVCSLVRSHRSLDCLLRPACLLTRSAALMRSAALTCSLALDCLLRSRPPLRSLVCSLAHFAHSLARGTVNDWMAILSVLFPVFDHSAAHFVWLSEPAVKEMAFPLQPHSRLNAL